MGIRVTRAITGSSVVFAAMLATAAQAGISGNAIVVTANNSNGTSQAWVVPTSAGTWDAGTQTWSYEAPAPVPLMTSGGTWIGTMQRFSMSAVEDPQISLDFVAVASSVDTWFTISTGLLTFAPFVPNFGVASSGITLTDTNGNGAVYTGMGPGGNGYSAWYNGFPGSNLYSAQIPGLAFAGPPFDTQSTNGFFMGAIGGPVGSMSAQWNFIVSAGDAASGTSTYVLLPAPGSVALLGLAGITASRRRR